MWNSPVTGEFPAQRASNKENVSIWWRHHVIHIDLLWGSWQRYCDMTLWQNFETIIALCCHWLKGLWQHQICVVIQGHGSQDQDPICQWGKGYLRTSKYRSVRLVSWRLKSPELDFFFSAACSGWYQRKHQNSLWLVHRKNKISVVLKAFLCHDINMLQLTYCAIQRAVPRRNGSWRNFTSVSPRCELWYGNSLIPVY